MKNLTKIFSILSLILIVSTSFGQLKYTSLNLACSSNASNSGVINNSRNVYVTRIAIDEYVFVNNSPNNFKRIPAGFYYYSPYAFQTDYRGKIIAIQNCNTVVPQGVFPNPPLDANLGIVGWLAFGSDYDLLKNEISGGTTKFDYYGKSNGLPMPTGNKNGNGYETVAFSSHSTTVGSGYSGIVSKCRYKITDAQGNVVIFVDDSRGGFSSTYGNNLRSNNHPDDCTRYLPVGVYTLEYSNTSNAGVNVPQSLKFWLQSAQNTYQIDEVVNSGSTVIRTITISDTGTQTNAFFKLNNNLL